MSRAAETSPMSPSRADRANAGFVPDRVNIAAALADWAARLPEKPAVVQADRRAATGWRSCTFAELDADAVRIATGLDALGLRRGERAIVMVRPSPEFFALTFALLRLGVLPVLIDPGMGRRNLVRCLANVDAAAFIGIPLAHVLRLLHRRELGSARLVVTVGRRFGWGGVTLADVRRRGDEAATRAPIADTAAGDPAAILFTSGSTGPAKGVLYTHGIFAAQVRYLREHYGYREDEVDLATFPLFALFDAALGMTAVIPDMDSSRPGSADPRKLVAAISTQCCTHMFGSPALLGNLARFAQQRRVQLPTLRRVITAGAPVRPALLSQLHEALSPDAQIHTPYGATESLPVSDIASREILGETAARTADGAGVCVGRPLEGMQVRIIAIEDRPIADGALPPPLAAGEIGEICVAGPVVTLEYFRRPDATAAAKIREALPDGQHRLWHRMGDVGYLDDAGRLWMCGRKAHRVVTDAGTLYTIPCEAIFNAHPAVARSALVGVGQDRARQKPMICIELNEAAKRAPRTRLRDELLAIAGAHPLTRSIRAVLFHPRFPVDVRHNAKIFREQLAGWAATKVRP